MENQYITKLKIILNSNILYILLLGICILLVIYKNCWGLDKSIYNKNDNVFILEIDNYKIDGNKLSLDLKGKENLVGTYYIKEYSELLKLQNKLKYGVRVKVQGHLNEINNNTILNTFNYKDYLKNKGIYYTLKIEKIDFLDNKINLVNKCKNLVNKRIMKIDNTGYMKAFILGDKELIDEDNYHKFQKIGVTHLFALSGMHIGLLSGIFLKLLKKLKFRYFIVDIILIGYGFLVGFPSSIKRCLLFFILNSFNKYFKLRVSNIKILFLTTFILVMIDVNILFDIGFRYSILTVLGILISTDFFKSKNKIISSFKLSLIAFLFSLPISLSSFYEVNILSVFYNIFYIPFVSIVVYPLSLLTFIFPFLNNLFSLSVLILEKGTSLLAKITLFNVYMNFNIGEIIVFYILLIVMIKCKKFILGWILVLIIALDLLYPYLDRQGYVYFFDVGQGDSCLVISPYRQDVILIDTGGIVKYTKEEWMKTSEINVSDNVVSFFKSQGIKKIDLLIISHGDFDHLGEVINFVNNFKIEKVIFNCGGYNDLEKELMSILENKNIKFYSCIKDLSISTGKLYFLNTGEYNNENDNSNVIYTEINNYKFLFMGDAGVDKEKDLLEKYNLSDIDFLKVGHHGSDTSSSKSFINTIKPKYAIISVGKNNRYGHPKKSVLDTLNGSKIYRTDLDGSIEIKIDKNEYTIKTCPP